MTDRREDRESASAAMAKSSSSRKNLETVFKPDTEFLRVLATRVSEPAARQIAKESFERLQESKDRWIEKNG